MLPAEILAFFGDGFSTESAISVLRIGDILWAKQDPQTPDWQSELNQDDD